MKFTEARFGEAVSLLRKMSRTGNPEDKRRSQRMKVNFNVLIQTSSDHPPQRKISAQLRDISAHGLSAVLKEPIYEGTTFAVELPNTTGSDQPLLCRVAHSAAQMDGTFLVGAEFIGFVGEQTAPEKTEDAEEERIRRSILG
jgi:hypothetical protein